MEFYFRDAKTGDEEQVLQLINTVLSAYELELEPAGADLDVTDLTKYYLSNNGWFQVIEHEGKIIGSVGIYKVNETTSELRKMYLYEEFQGRGLGKKLLDNALEKAKALGYTTVTLQTNSVLAKAIPLYVNYGFEEVKEEVCSRCDLAMSKTL